MARKIIILESNPPGTGNIAFKFAMWADVPAARQARYANATFVSEVVGATAGEISALQTGAVVEMVREAQWNAGTTIPQIQAALVAEFNAYQARITAANPWQRYGTSYDGTSWTAVSNG